ncbi:MAG: hypothetical protein AB7L71_03985 [Vicinamibacterales bacterium]
MRHHILPSTLAIVLLVATSAAAVGGNKAAYVGGTVTTVKEKAEGPLDIRDNATLTLSTKDGSLKIPYAAIESLEYGQKAGRRVAVAVLVSPLALFSKKRNHYLTIEFKDADGKAQAAVLELGKDIVRTALTVVETRSGKKIEYQDDEARKSGIGGK